MADVKTEPTRKASSAEDKGARHNSSRDSVLKARVVKPRPLDEILAEAEKKFPQTLEHLARS
jgi:hypothetical protein